MKHLKYFETYAEYKEFYKSGKIVTPNICGIKELNSARFFPYVKTAAPKVKMLFDATDTNLRLFNSSPKNMTKLTIDGSDYEIKPATYSTIITNTYASGIQVLEDSLAFPDSYLTPLEPTSYKLTPMDPNVSIEDIAYFYAYFYMSGESYFNPIPIAEFVAEGYARYDLPSNTLLIDDLLFADGDYAGIGFIWGTMLPKQASILLLIPYKHLILTESK